MLFGEAVDHGGGDASAETVVDIDDGDAGDAGVQHGEQGGGALHAGAIADAGGDCDDRGLRHAAHDGGKGAFHAGDDDQDAGFLEIGQVMNEAVETGYADIEDAADVGAHFFGDDGGFLGHGNIGGAGAEDGDEADGGGGGFDVEGDDPGGLVINGFREDFADGFVLGRVGTGGQYILAGLIEGRHDLDDVVGGLALGENDFWEAAAAEAVGIDTSEAEILFAGGIDVLFGGGRFELAFSDLIENLSKVHRCRGWKESGDASR